MTVQVISAFFAIIAFSVVNNVPKKFLFSCGVEGFVGWYVYLLFLSDTGPVMANFFGSLPWQSWPMFLHGHLKRR